MFQRRTLIFLAALLVGYALLASPAAIWPQYFDSALGLLVAVPFVSIYIFHWIGIPGLLENGGACGWGWCAPTPIGWCLLVVFWLLFAWLLAWGLAALTRSKIPDELPPKE